MAEPKALHRHRLGDCSKGLSLRTHGDDFVHSLLLGLMRNQFAHVAATETKGNLLTEVSAPDLLVRPLAQFALECGPYSA
jgi:hypothetical protein